MKKQLLVFCLSLLTVATVSAQFGMGGGTTIVHTKVNIESGEATPLKGQTIKLNFVYDGMAVGKHKDENEYIETKRKDYNEKEAGRGDKWATAWKADRAARFEPHFIEKFNEMGEKTKTIVSKDAGTYTLTVRTTFTDPGFNVGVMRRPAIINAVCEFKDGTGKSILVVSIDKCPGQTFGGYDFDTGERLGECYEKCAKELVKLLNKEWK